jgi:hypothetical protein
MVQAATPMIIPKKSQEGIIQFHRQCYNLLNQQWNLREQMREVDLMYMREQDITKENQRAKLVNRSGDPTRYQNFTIPVVMPQVEAAVVYQSSVFLQGTPLFGVVAAPMWADQAKQMETVVEENSIRGGWTRELMMVFRDGFKYNLSALEVTWDRKVTAALDSDITFANGMQGKPKEVIWEGNCLKRWDLYNTFFDTRVPPSMIHSHGEYAGKTELMSRIALKQFLANLPDKMVANIPDAFASGMGATTVGGMGIESFYVPNINPSALLNKDIRSGTNWLAWAGLDGERNGGIEYKNLYEVTTLYGRILPSDFGLKVPSANTPQVWKFIIVNHQVLIYAERLTNAHGYIPVLFSQPSEDGLTYQTKSLATNVAPIQQVNSALVNSMIAASRRAIADRGLYDPSRVTEANINSANPSAKIPVRPAAYGKPLSEAYYPIPFRDDQSQFVMQKIGFLNQYANQISGSNPAKQGQFVKGNKTQSEFDSVMSNANGRDQMTSMLLEAQLFTPLKEIIKTNILQYQGGVSYFSPATNKQVEIDPIELRKAVMAFKVSDGLTPADKLINSDIMMVAMQTIGQSQAIGAGYNIPQLFSYLMKTQGAELKEFEKSQPQVAYESAVGQWQQVVMQLVKDNPQIKPEQYPPMPVPQQYGYVPGTLASEQAAATQQQSNSTQSRVLQG